MSAVTGENPVLGAAFHDREQDRRDFGALIMEIVMTVVLVAAGGFLTYLALDAVRRAK